MKIFVTGGTGVLGTRMVPQLIDSGHEVGVLSRSAENSSLIQNMGATALTGDLFDREQIIQLTKGYDMIIHAATAIPQKNRMKPQDWELNSRIRVEGTKNLLEAAKINGVTQFIQQSIVFAYGNRNGEWVDEDTEIIQPIPQKVNMSSEWHNVAKNTIEMENLIKSYSTLQPVILRCGWFYSHDSDNVETMLRGKFPIVGGGQAYWNLITVDDAATAFVHAVEKYNRVAGQILNIVDDQPVKSIDFLTYAGQLGGKKPMKLPLFLVRVLLGAYSANFVANSVRVSNDKAKSMLNWRPKYSTYEEGLQHEQKMLQSVLLTP